MEIKIIDNLSPSRWKEYRKLRLRAIFKEPQAFGITFKERLRELFFKNKKQWQADLTEQKLFFVEANHTLVGLVRIHFPKMKTGKVNSLFIIPKFRKRGLGKQLMCKSLDYLRKESFKSAIMSVTTAHKDTLTMYSDLGFKVSEYHQNRFKFNGQHFDYIQMELQFI